jgi:hypothetical protein
MKLLLTVYPCYRGIRFWAVFLFFWLSFRDSELITSRRTFPVSFLLKQNLRSHFMDSLIDSFEHLVYAMNRKWRRRTTRNYQWYRCFTSHTPWHSILPMLVFQQYDDNQQLARIVAKERKEQRSKDKRTSNEKRSKNETAVAIKIPFTLRIRNLERRLYHLIVCRRSAVFFSSPGPCYHAKRPWWSEGNEMS